MPAKKLLRKGKTFLFLPLRVKWLFIEALYTSAWVKLSLSFFPFKKVMGWLGKPQIETTATANPQTIATRKEVKRALELCNKYAPWPTECYTLSLTGKLLLQRRHIDSTLYIGFRKDEYNAYKGHAWLRANDMYISGYKESVGFTIHSLFS